MPGLDIYRAYNFVLDLQGVNAGFFSEVTGLSVDVEVIEYRSGGDPAAVSKLPGRVSYGDITLKWGVSDNQVLWDWLVTAVNGAVEKRDVSIILMKPNGMDEQMRWNLRSAWASQWRGSKLDAMGQDAAIETLTLTHEGLERA